MPSTETPVKKVDEAAIPHLLVQLEDDLSRSRMREAFWISLIIHLLLVIALALSPRYIERFGQKTLVVATPEDLIRDRELTYLEAPPDAQKPQQRPNTDIISDKDRIASSRQPTLDRKALRELLDSARPGLPGPPGQQAPAAPPSPPPVAQPPSQQQSPGVQGPGQGPQQQNQTDNQQLATLEDLRPSQSAPGGGTFRPGMSPRSVIEQAARAAAAGRASGVGGSLGNYGTGSVPRGQTGVQSNLEILTDTMGVDFGPYLSRVLHDVRLNWYNLIPEVARPPLLKYGKVSIEFAILKDGRVSGMRIIGPSGDVALDRAAWGGIQGSNPFPPLPNEFQGQYLALRFHFFYNPDRNELR